MKKKIIIAVSIFVVLVLIVGGVFLFLNKEYPDDENTLYTIKFGNTKLRFERYDNFLFHRITPQQYYTTKKEKCFILFLVRNIKIFRSN